MNAIAFRCSCLSPFLHRPESMWEGSAQRGNNVTFCLDCTVNPPAQMRPDRIPRTSRLQCDRIYDHITCSLGIQIAIACSRT